jgi:hypothetical protein
MENGKRILPAVGYRFFDFDHGFEVRGRGKEPVRVVLDIDQFQLVVSYCRDMPPDEDSFMEVKYEQRMREQLRYGSNPVRIWGHTHHRSVLLSDMHGLARVVAYGLMSKWEVPQGKQDRWGVREWATTQTAKAVASRVRDRWREILARHFEAQFVALLRRIFSVTFCHLSQEMCRHLAYVHHMRPMLYRDIMNHRAAAHAVVLWPRGRKNLDETTWIDVFGPRNILSRSKRRTLMNLPTGVSTRAVRGFRGVTLDRPLTTRMGVNWAGAWSNASRHVADEFAFFYATDKDLLRASDRFIRHVHMEKAKPGQARVFFSMAQYISDWTSNMGNNEVFATQRIRTVNGALKRAIAWHAQYLALYLRNQIDYYGKPDVEENALPPIPLPEDERIRFLATPQDVIDETYLMNHCVIMYAHNAAVGAVYLFHTEYGDSMATTAVLPDGRVQQSYGPRNTINRASRYAKRVLAKWGKGLNEAGAVYVNWQDEAGRMQRERVGELPEPDQLAEQLRDERIGRGDVQRMVMDVDGDGNLRARPFNVLPQVQ